MSRREFDMRIRAQAADRAKGRCERYSNKLMAGGYHYDHIVPDGLGGQPTLDNCQVLCLTCHKAKTTREDNPRMQKADAQRKKHLYGIRPVVDRPTDISIFTRMLNPSDEQVNA